MIWTDTIAELMAYLNNLYNIHPTIKFTLGNLAQAWTQSSARAGGLKMEACLTQLPTFYRA